MMSACAIANAVDHRSDVQKVKGGFLSGDGEKIFERRNRAAL